MEKKINYKLFLSFIVLVVLTLIRCNDKDHFSEKVKYVTKRELKEIIKHDTIKVKNVVEVVKFRTKVEYNVKTETQVNYDTIYQKDTVKIYPIYQGYAGDKFAKAYITARYDTISATFNLQNDSKILYSQKNARSEIHAQIHNSSPYFKSDSLRSYKLRAKDQIFELEPTVSVGVDAFSLRPTAVVGFGIGIDVREIKKRWKR